MKKRFFVILLMLAMVVTLFACGNQTEPEKEDDPTPTSEYTLGKWEYVARSYTYSGQTFDRYHYYYIPANFDPSKPASLVFSLHGSLSNAYYQRAFDDWETMANNNNCIVIIPEGVGIDINGTLSAEGKSITQLGRTSSDIGYIRFHASVVDPHQSYGVDDVTYLSDLIDEMVNAGYVDAKKVYISGYSHGGFMAIRMAIEAPEKIAGICADAALMLDEYVDRIPTEKVKVVLINGDKDTTVPIKGMVYDLDNDGIYDYTWALSREETINWFLKTNGIDKKDVTTEMLEDKSPYDATTVERFAYGEDTAYPVISYLIYGGGHTWPGTTMAVSSVLGNATKDIRGSEIIEREFLIPGVSK